MEFEEILKRLDCIRLAEDGSAVIYTVKFGRFCVEEVAFPMTDEFQREFAAEFSKLCLPSR
jgi:hypothetical protein